MRKTLTKMLALGTALLLSAGVLSACGGGTTTAKPAGTTEAAGTAAAQTTVAASSAAPSEAAAAGKVYFLNFKPEQDEAYQKIAADYTAKTGVPVKVLTAAAGTYEQTLMAEIAKTDAPTIFQINGPVGYANWKDYTADLKDSAVYQHLLDKSIAIKDGAGVFGIPFAIEGYGVIYNDAIMQKYCALDGAVVKSAADITSLDVLKKVAADMTAKKDQLGIKGVFASTSMAPGEDWRWQTHLANVPVYYEFQANKVDLGDPKATATIKFQFGDNFKQLFDLYLDYSTVEKTLVGSKTVADSMAEFALGEAAMVQNGNWAYGQIAGVNGNQVKAEDVKFLPLYIGVDDAKEGICIGTENFFCINSKASAEDQKASLDFLSWLYTSDEGKAYVTNELHFIAPFDTFGETEKPSDPLAKEMLAWSAKTGIQNVPWNFTVFPSQAFKDQFGAALLQYAQGNLQWEEVAKTFVDAWAKEKANAQ